MKLFFLLFILLLGYYIIEKIINDRCLASFKAVIHVNGIRGKTSTCRYIDAALRKKYRVFTKTTGTDAMMLHTDGRETPVKRLGAANIHEQLGIIRRARKEGAEILVLECMAVNPVLQKTAQEQIVKSDMTVITNVRYDHVFEMGDSLDEIAESLSCTVPTGGTLFTADQAYADFFARKCEEKSSELVFCPSASVAEENISIAREISKRLGISESAFAESLSEVKEDFGISRIYPLENKAGEVFYFLNLFSANDPVSTIHNTEQVKSSYSGIRFLYNHRGDRPDRALLFARYFFPHYRDTVVYLTGKGASLPCRLFRKAGLKDLRVLSDYRHCLDQPAGTLLIGIGNIKGAGYEMIEQLEKKGGLAHE